MALIVTCRLESWHRDAAKPQLWQWAAYAVIIATTFLLVRLGAPIKNHFYMHYGLSAVGQFMLYGVTLHEVLRARQAVVAAGNYYPPLEQAA